MEMPDSKSDTYDVDDEVKNMQKSLAMLTKNVQKLTQGSKINSRKFWKQQQ